MKSFAFENKAERHKSTHVKGGTFIYFNIAMVDHTALMAMLFGENDQNIHVLLHSDHGKLAKKHLSLRVTKNDACGHYWTPHHILPITRNPTQMPMNHILFHPLWAL